MIEDAELLRRYTEEKSEAAFAELVQRHVNFVYACALRRVGGDAHLAEDVTQHVFTALARGAAALARREVLSGWLYTTARNASAQVVRSERRQHAREQEAHTMNELTSSSAHDAEWERLRPVLDDAMDRLSDDDRQAVLLRYYEGKSFADVGARLRLTDNAARMRVERALEKMRDTLARHGVTSTTAALALALANQAGVAAPTGLAASVTGAALAGAATAGGETGAAVGASLLSFMSTAKIIIASAAVIAVAAIGVATNQVWETRATHAELAATGRQQDGLQAKLRTLEGNLAAAGRRAQAADADAAQLLKAIQDASPTVGLPPGDAACVAFVIDTSGSMRNPDTGKLWSVVSQAIADTLAAHPEVKFLQGFDADGRIIFNGRNDWLPRTPESLQTIEQALSRYDQDTISTPVPGIFRAMRVLPPAGKTGARLHVCVIGDEFVDQAEPVLRRLDELNPADANGIRRASISAIQLPTTVRTPGGPMAATGLKFRALMEEVAKQHAGTYKLLPAGVLR